ncbi:MULTISPECIES: glycosyltransferase family 2 protein [Priestia]|uniref:glycosyltransferase family 2 protein n=1 Tax=Priestia TaxID=2800373 RepID=UPI000D3E3B19|nr:glycosyltransferase family 2 protein [Priestia megaterium]AWD66040.1 glycosyl transferase [Priestia megaterium]
MKKPLISVILPIYNVENYIEECLESLVNQTIGHEKLEVLMVNDCSTDNTAKIIDEYAARFPHFKAIHLPENTGAPGKPRNVGIEQATGKYLIFLDPDDYIPLDAYESLYQVAHENNSDFVMGKMISFDEEDGREYEHVTFKNYLLQKQYYNVTIKDAPFFLQVKTAVYLKLVKTSFIKNHGISFIEGMKNGEDKYYDMQLFTKAKKFSYIPKVIYMYRARNDEKNLSLTQRDIVSTVENDVKAAKLVKPLLNDESYAYFQINALRSLLWKICDPDFNRLEWETRLYLIHLVTDVVKDYDKRLVEKYLALEEPFLSLINKGYIQEALEYNKMLASRRWWYKQGRELQIEYRKHSKIRKSFSWKITKFLRNRNIRLKQLIKRRYINEGKRSHNFAGK